MDAGGRGICWRSAAPAYWFYLLCQGTSPPAGRHHPRSRSSAGARCPARIFSMRYRSGHRHPRRRDPVLRLRNALGMYIDNRGQPGPPAGPSMSTRCASWNRDVSAVLVAHGTRTGRCRHDRPNSSNVSRICRIARSMWLSSMASRTPTEGPEQEAARPKFAVVVRLAFGQSHTNASDVPRTSSAHVLRKCFIYLRMD